MASAAVMMDVDSSGANDLHHSEKKYAEQDQIQELLNVLNEISKTTTTLDPRYIWRSLKDLSSFRNQELLNAETLSFTVNVLYPDSSSFKKNLLKSINSNHKSLVSDSDELRNSYPASFYTVNTERKTIEVTPEINCFIHLLVQLFLWDSKKLQELVAFNRKVVIPQLLCFYNLRSLNLINAKLWFYIYLSHETLSRGSIENDNDNQNIILRSTMMKFLKIASLKHDNETKAMLINLILRDFLNNGEVDSASDFVSKLEFPHIDVSSSLEARYFFYLSKINAIQLDYSTANEYIIAAIRKAPHNSKSLGFSQQSNKLHCCIQLLMGDIPELSFFHQSNMQKSLLPYYQLTKTVKLGDLKKFTSTITKYKQLLLKDDTYQLCVRLRSNVIKTGIRIISLTYKKISLRDICLKLNLDSEQTVEYMVSRAIRDGVIEAKINHEDGFIETTELLNIYDSEDPQQVFDERIKFANQLHDEYLVSMRYPEDKKTQQKEKNENGDDDDDLIDGDLLDDMSDISDLDDLGFL